MVLVTEAAHFAAVKALLTDSRPYSADELDALSSLPDWFTQLYVTERFTGSESDRLAGISDLTAWRVTTRVVARSEHNARAVRDRNTAALLEAVVVVDGRESTPMRRGATDDPIGPDEGYFSGLSEFTYYL